MLAMARQTNGLYPKAVTYSWWEQFGLTQRETEVAVYLSDGLQPKDIAGRLCVCVRTVQHHIKSISRKVRADSTMHAAIILYRSRKIN